MQTGDSGAPPLAELDDLTSEQRAVRQLSEAGIEFVVLRGLDATGAPGGDVDILVDSRMLESATGLLRSWNWLEAPSTGHGSHRFFVTFDGERWGQLDLVTHLDFGPLQQYRTGLAGACLQRRRVQGGLPLLHHDDDFWLTVLHLAWKEGTPARTARLAHGAVGATTSGPVAAFVASQLGADHEVLEGLLQAAQSQEAETVLTAQRTLRERWLRQSVTPVAVRATLGWLGRRLVPSLRSGVAVAFIGLDGAGKTTVTERLGREVSWPSVSLYMGVWRTSALDEVVQRVIGAQLALRMGRLTRIAALVRYHRRMGRLVLLDRALVDAGLPTPDLDWKGRVSRVLVSRIGAPPDRFVFLDAPAEVVFARKGELNVEELSGRREFYRGLSRGTTWRTVDADRPLGDVLRDVNRIVWDDLVARQR